MLFSWPKKRNQGSGILDNDYMAAFDYMVLTWVFKVLKAKGLNQETINRLKNLYGDHLTVVVVNNVQGRCFLNIRWSIRQGDRPSSILFCFGLDPHLDWLENMLTGIPIYENQLCMSNQSKELYKLIAYVDDVKPAITSFSLLGARRELLQGKTCQLTTLFCQSTWTWWG